MSLIKDIYSPSFFEKFSLTLEKVIPGFNKKKFITRIFDQDFVHKEWKERMKHTTIVFHSILPTDYVKAVKMIGKIIETLRADKFGEDSLAFMFLPDYIETYGLKDFKTSMKAFVLVTQFVSCEFAVRPFLLHYGNTMVAEMTTWSLHKSHKVRRLASEGSRPRLPWAMAIPALKKDPTPILQLLDNLKNDPSEWVRRSVANNLNDIAKDHPDIVVRIAATWKGISRETDAIIKHGCRTLLKQGHTEILKQYGLSSKNINLINLKILTPKITIGSNLEFSFTISNDNKTSQTIRLEYGIYYQKSKGHLSRKVYKISERNYAAGEQMTINRKQSFRLITTRVFHTGLHQLSIIINGEEKGIQDFTLLP